MTTAPRSLSLANNFQSFAPPSLLFLTWLNPTSTRPPRPSSPWLPLGNRTSLDKNPRARMATCHFSCITTALNRSSVSPRGPPPDYWQLPPALADGPVTPFPSPPLCPPPWLIALPHSLLRKQQKLRKCPTPDLQTCFHPPSYLCTPPQMFLSETKPLIFPPLTSQGLHSGSYPPSFHTSNLFPLY